MSQRTKAALLAFMILAVSLRTVPVLAQQVHEDDIVRRAKSRVAPEYPELARKMKLAGAVKIAVVVAPNGTVKDAHVVGGHPLLANAALAAAKKWRFEPAPAETSGVIDFKFEPQ